MSIPQCWRRLSLGDTFVDCVGTTALAVVGWFAGRVALAQLPRLEAGQLMPQAAMILGTLGAGLAVLAGGMALFFALRAAVALLLGSARGLRRLLAGATPEGQLQAGGLPAGRAAQRP